MGRHLVAEALRRGYEVTLFNRGRSNPDLFPEVEKLIGDRDGDLNVLMGGRWDAVVDTSAYIPRVVSDSASLLSNLVDHYTFISTMSVYADLSKPGLNESSPVGVLADPENEELTGETYGPLKALCEQAAEKEMPDRALIIRPGLIVGPNDPTDRFSYWPNRISQGGEILAPAPAETPVQFIDVRDLAEWTLDMIAARRTGTFNVVGPVQRLSFGIMLDEIRKALDREVDFTWANPDFLLENEVQPWMNLPLWLGPGEYEGMLSASIERALEAGLSFRSLAETARDTLKWLQSRPADHEWRAGITLERERELLASWHARGS